MKTGGKRERSSHLGILSFHCLSVMVQVVCTLLHCHVSLGQEHHSCYLHYLLFHRQRQVRTSAVKDANCCFGKEPRASFTEILNSDGSSECSAETPNEAIWYGPFFQQQTLELLVLCWCVCVCLWGLLITRLMALWVPQWLTTVNQHTQCLNDQNAAADLNHFQKKMDYLHICFSYCAALPQM